MPGRDPHALGAGPTQQDDSQRADQVVSIGPFTVRANTSEVEDFADALGTRAAFGPAPLTFPMRWLCLPELRDPVARGLGLANALLVQQSQSFTYARPLKRDRDYRIEAEARRDSSGRVTLRATISEASGGTVVISETVMRIVDATTTAPAPRRLPPFAGGDIPELRVWPIGLREARRYAAASLDDNPLHSDPAAARAAGLEGPIVHGMLLAGQFERALLAWRPLLTVRRCRATFLRPLPLGSSATIASRLVQSTQNNSHEQLVIRLAIRNDAEELLIVGEVEAQAPA